MASPVGGCWQQCVTSVRAGINRYQLLSQHVDILAARTHEAFLPVLPGNQASSQRAQRCLQLALMAMRDLYQQADIDEPPPVLIGLPEPFEGGAQVGAELLQELAEIGRFDFALPMSNAYRYGRAGGLAAVHGAFDMLTERTVKQVIVGGVDSWVDPDTLQALAATERPFKLGEAKGLVPGEAAAFLLLDLDHPKLARVNRPAFAQQDSKQPGDGDGDPPVDALSDAVVEACDLGNVSLLPSVYPSTNGEPAQLEHCTTALRQLKVGTLAENLKITQAFQAMGDVGAAFGPILIGLAAADIGDDPQRSPALVCAASDAQYRAAVTVTSA